MSIRRDPEAGRQAVLWLATAFVILIGSAACAFIILAAVERPSQHLLIWGAMFGGLVVLLLTLAVPSGKHGTSRWLLEWLVRERSNSRQVLRIGRKQRAARIEFGTNSPPTLDSVREASEQNVTWVPHGPPNPPRPR